MDSCLLDDVNLPLLPCQLHQAAAMCMHVCASDGNILKWLKYVQLFLSLQTTVNLQRTHGAGSVEGLHHGHRHISFKLCASNVNQIKSN